MMFLNNASIVLICGLISGVSLLITGNTLNFWLAKSGFSKETLGLFALVALPYSINFLWAPIFDKFQVPFLSKYFEQKLGWVTLLCAMMSLFTFILSFIAPNKYPLCFAILSCCISFFATSKDSVLGALRIELLTTNEQATTAGIYVSGYRIGMMISGSGAIFLSAYTSWSNVYKFLSLLCIIIPIILVLIIKRSANDTQIKITQGSGIKQTLYTIFNLKNIFLILLFLVLYRLPDNFISIMLNAFMLDLTFNEIEIALYSKTLGTIGSIFGSLIAGFFLHRMTIQQGLMKFGIVHILAHVMLIIQALYGKSIMIMAISVIVESITGGMCMSAYMAFITSMCTGKYKATQYSIFSAVMGLSRSLFPSLSGIIAAQLGWVGFFSVCMLISIPPLLLINYIKNNHT